MSELISARSWREPGNPAAGDSETARVCGLVAAIAGSGAVAISLGSILVAFSEPFPGLATVLTLGAMLSLCLVTLHLARRAAPTAAGRLLVFTGTVGTTALVLTGRTTGFDDIGMLLYPVLVVVASLVLRRLEALIATGMLLVSLGLILATLWSGRLPTTKPPTLLLADCGFAAIIVAVCGVAAHFMAAAIEHRDRETRPRRKALALANRELQAEAAARESLIEALEARNTELQHFTHTVSHDLKSPLVTIGGFVGCMKRDIASGARQRLADDLERIRAAHAEMGDLLDGLLDLSRVGRLPGTIERVPFAEIVDAASSQASEVVAARGARLVITDELPMVRGDRQRLVQLVQSLIENAVKFSPVSMTPTVEIGAKELQDETVFYVRDRGIGIEPGHRQRIFQAFRKLRPESPGIGLGLALAKRIVEVHGGRIWVESEGMGKGAVFRFTLGAQS